MQAEEQELWDAYAVDRSVEKRNRLVEFYMPFLKRLAAKKWATLPDYAEMELDDLVNDGMFGLVECVERFDTSRKLHFQTFAGLRIIGSMTDAIRRLDFVPRLERQRQRTDGIVPTSVMSLEGLTELTDISDRQNFVLECLGVEDEPDPKGDEFWAWILRGFTRQERLVLMLYFREGVVMKKIGKQIGVSESRVSQMMTELLPKLRKRIERSEEDSTKEPVEENWRPRPFWNRVTYVAPDFPVTHKEKDASVDTTELIADNKPKSRLEGLIEELETITAAEVDEAIRTLQARIDKLTVLRNLIAGPETRVATDNQPAEVFWNPPTDVDESAPRKKRKPRDRSSSIVGEIEYRKRTNAEMAALTNMIEHHLSVSGPQKIGEIAKAVNAQVRSVRTVVLRDKRIKACGGSKYRFE